MKVIRTGALIATADDLGAAIARLEPTLDAAAAAMFSPGAVVHFPASTGAEQLVTEQPNGLDHGTQVQA